MYRIHTKTRNETCFAAGNRCKQINKPVVDGVERPLRDCSRRVGVAQREQEGHVPDPGVAGVRLPCHQRLKGVRCLWLRFWVCSRQLLYQHQRVWKST